MPHESERKPWLTFTYKDPATGKDKITGAVYGVAALVVIAALATGYLVLNKPDREAQTTTPPVATMTLSPSALVSAGRDVTAAAGRDIKDSVVNNQHDNVQTTQSVSTSVQGGVGPGAFVGLLNVTNQKPQSKLVIDSVEAGETKDGTSCLDIFVRAQGDDTIQIDSVDLALSATTPRLVNKAMYNGWKSTSYSITSAHTFDRLVSPSDSAVKVRLNPKQAVDGHKVDRFTIALAVSKADAAGNLSLYTQDDSYITELNTTASVTLNYTGVDGKHDSLTVAPVAFRIKGLEYQKQGDLGGFRVVK